MLSKRLLVAPVRARAASAVAKGPASALQRRQLVQSAVASCSKRAPNRTAITPLSSSQVSSRRWKQGRTVSGNIRRVAVQDGMQEDEDFYIKWWPQERTEEFKIPADAPKVKFHFVDLKGNRRQVVGQVGETVLDVAWREGIDMPGCCGGGTPGDYGEGPQCVYCHVYIPQHDAKKFPELTEFEKFTFEKLGMEHVSASSRFACTLPVTEDMQDTFIAVPDYPNVRTSNCGEF